MKKIALLSVLSLSCATASYAFDQNLLPTEVSSALNTSSTPSSTELFKARQPAVELSPSSSMQYQTPTKMFGAQLFKGAFASTAKEMGAIDATIELTLSILPSKLILGGLFAAACFISLSVGTSVGTIAALTPIATNMAEHTGHSIPLLVSVLKRKKCCFS